MEAQLDFEKLPQQTQKRLAWFLQVPPNGSIADRFRTLPFFHGDEGDVIIAFSKYTRGLAGEDPEAPPDEVEEERRLKQVAFGGAAPGAGYARDTSAAAAAAVPTNAGISRNSGNSSKPISNGDKTYETERKLPSGKRRKQDKGLGGGSNRDKERDKERDREKEKEPAGGGGHSPLEEGRRVIAKLDDAWIMMTVLRYNKRTRTYTLEDADDQAESKEEHEIDRKSVVPLLDPEKDSGVQYEKGDRVLAHYPNTTSFYPATVFKIVKKANATGKQNKGLCEYMLQFDDDDEDANGEILPKKIKGEFVIKDPNA